MLMMFIARIVAIESWRWIIFLWWSIIHLKGWTVQIVSSWKMKWRS